MKTKNRLLISLLLVSGPIAWAQEVTPVRVQHINETVNVAEADRLPILRKQGAEAVAFDGNSTQLTVNGSFVRWTGSTDLAQDPDGAPLPMPGEVITNANSFTIRASGYAAFDVADFVGDNGFFRYETVTGDFDRRVRLVSLQSEPVLDPIAAMTRAGLMLRQSTNANSPALEIFAANPEGANLVRVAGRGRVDQVYSQTLSRNYPGVAENLPNQWLRMRRVGNSFAFYVGTNGTNWSLISEQYQIFPATVVVGTFAAPDDASGLSVAVAEFADYGDVVTPDTVPPALVSVGTIDRKWVGVKFSEPVSSLTSTRHANYTLSEGTVIGAQGGIGPNTVYLEVVGLTNDTFIVSVNGVVDLAGNPVAPNSSASGRVSNWISTDIGYIQDPANRPTVGDDPYLPGRAVAVSSETNPEVEIIGGGSNAYNIGDYIHYLYRSYTGDFDVVAAVERFDKRGFAGGYANSGIHVRSGLYRTDTEEIGENTKVPAYVNVTYYEASGPDRAAIELNRPNPGDDYGNNTPNGNDTEVGGLLGFFTGLNAIDAAGTLSPQSSPTQAKWLRVKRTGNAFTSYFSYDGQTWFEQDQGNRVMENLPATVLVGFGNQNDTGYGIPPNNTYAGNGTVDDNGFPAQNESNYGVIRISHFGDLATAFPEESPILTVARDGTDLRISWSVAGFELQAADSVTGPYAPAGLTVVPEGEASTVTVTPTGTGKFYRLVK